MPAFQDQRRLKVEIKVEIIMFKAMLWLSGGRFLRLHMIEDHNRSFPDC